MHIHGGLASSLRERHKEARRMKRVRRAERAWPFQRDAFERDRREMKGHRAPDPPPLRECSERCSAFLTNAPGRLSVKWWRMRGKRPTGISWSDPSSPDEKHLAPHRRCPRLLIVPWSRNKSTRTSEIQTTHPASGSRARGSHNVFKPLISPT